ncbi:MAG TPA: histone deacetylase family protein [Roseiflexaceae bacterium]|nr:histone deacetylase family protein [Roseiflexaceae bacterium]HMP39844.1 histone deacetylase family protein [Roseiflexaceae bacterium]
MISIIPTTTARHDPPHEFLDGALVPVFESPERAAIIRDALQAAALGACMPPRSFGIEPIRAIHSAAYLEYLEHAYERWVAAGGAPEAVLPSTLAVRWMARPSADPLAAPGFYCFDLSAPIVAGTFAAACDSAAAALTGAALLIEGQPAAYALCRPPGHHAGSDMCGGYCYLNNAAIAAQYLIDHAARPCRVAILDIDFHHGNGTQQIFYERADVFFASLHADPAHHYPYFLGYPDERGAGVGYGTNLNLVLDAGVSDTVFLAALTTALDAVAAYAPSYLIISAGLDTFAGDPVAANSGSFALSSAAFPAIGRQIARLDLPTLFVQEGGYAVAELGENVVGLLRGFVQR